MLPYEGSGSTALTPEAALALQRAMERGFTNSQPAPATAPAGGGGYVGMPDFSAQAYSGPSAQSMAASQFGPQYQILQNLVDQAKSQYDTGFSTIGSVYNSLADKVAAQSGDIRNQYDQTGQRVGGAFNEAINSVSGTALKNQQAIAEMLQRLGIQQAAPDALGGIGEQMQRQVGYLAQNQASRGAFNAQQGQNELDFNNRTAANDRLAGTNKQADLTRNYGQQQFDLGNKKLDLQSQQQQAENGYAQAIAKMQQDSQSGAFDQWYKMQQLNRTGQNDDVARGRLELDTAKFADEVANYKDTSSLNAQKALNSSGDAYAILASRAGQMLGEGTPQAADAVQRIIRAYQTASSDKNGAATLNDILQYASFNSQSAQEAQVMQALATVWYQQLGNKQQYGVNF